MQHKAEALEKAVAKCKLMSAEQEVLKERVRGFEEELAEREACEAKVQEYVKQLLAERN